MRNDSTTSLQNRTGIYQIKNIIDGRIYVGSSVSIGKRINAHKRRLSKNIHTNNHLQSSWNKYGQDSFEFSVLESVSINKDQDRQIVFDSLRSLESRFIRLLQSNDPHKGYNQADPLKERSTFTGAHIGEQCRKAIITEKQAAHIKFLSNLDYTDQVIADFVGATKYIVSSVRNGCSWVSVQAASNAPRPAENAQKRSDARKMDCEKVKQIKFLLSLSHCCLHICDYYGYGDKFIAAIRDNKRFADILLLDTDTLRLQASDFYVDFSNYVNRKVNSSHFPKGQNCPSAILTIEKVLEVKNRFDNSESVREISQSLNLSKGTVYDICAGKTWDSITGYEQRAISGKALRRLTTEESSELNRLLKEGKRSKQELMHAFNVSKGTINGRLAAMR